MEGRIAVGGPGLHIGIGVLTLCLAACTSTQTVGYPAEYVSIHSPKYVWVTRGNKAVEQIYDPTVHGDTLVGFDHGSYTELPISDVRLMRASVLNPTKTALFASAVAIGAAVAVVELTGQGGPASVCLTPGTDFVTVCGEKSAGQTNGL